MRLEYTEVRALTNNRRSYILHAVSNGENLRSTGFTEQVVAALVR